MKNKIIFFLFFLISIFPLFSQNKIPQRVIFFLQDATDDKNIDIKRYIENEIKKILEVLDSELIIRYTKEEEYKQYLNLLTPLTIDNMKKFYFNTNVRGIVSFSTKEENNKFLVQIECYNLNTGDVIKKDVTIEREKIIENINEFDNFIRELIIKNFPQIERKSIKEERFALLKLVREMPEFFLNVKGDIGYSSKYIQYRVFSSNSSSEDRQHNEYHNGFNIGFGVEGKIKLFYIGAGVNFLPYIVTNSDSFWFDITAYLETGFFLIQEILLVKSGCIAGVISTYDYLTENRIKIIPTIIGYIEIGAYPTKYIYPFFNMGIGVNIYNMPGVKDLVAQLAFENIAYVILIMKFGFIFYFKNNFFIGLNSSTTFTVINGDVEFEFKSEGGSYDRYKSNIWKNQIIVSFGYRFEKRNKK